MKILDIPVGVSDLEKSAIMDIIMSINQDSLENT